MRCLMLYTQKPARRRRGVDRSDQLLILCTPRRSRTLNLWSRNPALYPVELWVQKFSKHSEGFDRSGEPPLNPQSRNLVFYPVELRVQNGVQIYDLSKENTHHRK